MILVLRAILSFRRIRKGRIVRSKSVVALNAMQISGRNVGSRATHTTLSKEDLDHITRSPTDDSVSKLPMGRTQSTCHCHANHGSDIDNNLRGNDCPEADFPFLAESTEW
jgi:hypothetical protein